VKNLLVEIKVARCYCHGAPVVAARRVGNDVGYQVKGCRIDNAGDFRDASEEEEYEAYLPIFLAMEAADRIRQ
jgi:hypothetical protein